MPVVWAVSILGLLVYAAIRAWAQDALMTQDAHYYLGMTVGRPTPAPYCRRVFMPFLARLLSSFTRLDRRQAMRVVTVASTWAVVVLSAALSMWLGAEPWLVAMTLLLLVSTDGLTTAFAAYAYNPDATSTALALAAAFVDPWSAALLMVLSALSKEGPFFIGSAFLVVAGWAPWWVPMPGLVALAVAFFAVKAAPPDQEWLKNPLRSAQWAKRTDQWDWGLAISGLKATPFVAAFVLPASALGPAALAASILAWLQTIAAQDRVRLVAAAIPWVLPAAVVAAPEWLLWPWAVLQVFWPWRKDIS